MESKSVFSDTARRCIEMAGELAARRGHSLINSGHLLLAFFEMDASRAFIVLDSIGIEGYDVKKELDRLKPRIGLKVENPVPGPELEKLFMDTANLCDERNCGEIEEHLLLMASMRDESLLSYKIIKNLGFSPSMIVSESEAQA